MQPNASFPAISLNPQLLFSRTSSDLDTLCEKRTGQFLNIRLVLGQDALAPVGGSPPRLQLQQEAANLAQILQQCGKTDTDGSDYSTVPCQVDTLIQPTPSELISRLETGIYNIFFYAGQYLLTLYKFNLPAGTLPGIYMHPEFDGVLIQPKDDLSTDLPENSTTFIRQRIPQAFLRSPEAAGKVWPIRGGLMRVGRLSENDLVIEERWVSQTHAEIFCRDSLSNDSVPVYFLRDFSRYGTLMLMPDGWQKVHHQVSSPAIGRAAEIWQLPGPDLGFCHRRLATAQSKLGRLAQRIAELAEVPV